MGYSGQTYQVRCDRGGLTHNANVDLIEPIDMVPPTRNINLDENGRRKRGGTSHISESAISGTPTIMGLYDFRLKNGTQYIIRACDDGALYSDDSTQIDDGVSTTTYFDFETFDDELYIVDGNTTPQKWTGTGSTADLGGLPTDWAGTAQPQWITKHGRGASERLWAGGVPGLTETIYASANGDGDDFSDANVITISIETGDGFGIVGARDFGDRLFCFGKRQTYIIDDLDVNTDNWGYDQAQWTGGAASFRLICNTPNDIIAMMEDGEIYSVRSAQEYGDYKSASLVRPSFMHRYINEFIDMSKFDQFHMQFDPTMRAVKIFVVRSGQSSVNTSLVYFIDRPVKEAWSVHSNETSDSGYSAASSALVRKSEGVWKIYTGDYGGIVWELETANRNDNSEAYYGGFKTANMTMDNPRIRKNFKRGWLLTKPEGAWNLSVKWWVDGVSQTTRNVSLAGTGGLLGSFVLGTSVLGGEDLIDSAFQLGANGKRIQFEAYNTTVDQDFFVSQILCDFKPLGEEPS